MPSIPQSLLWISLVVLWLFVLVPMLISKRDAVRRTSDVALATRVLNSGAAARLLKRGGPAAGHRSNPEWQPDEDEHEDLEDLGDLDSDDTEEMPQSGGVVVAAAVTVEETGPDAEVLAADSAVVAETLPSAEEQPEPVAEDDTSDDEDTEDTEDSDGSTRLMTPMTRAPINTNTSTTHRGYRSPRNRRRPSLTRFRGGSDTTWTPPLL
jgi:hypothetical protein